MAKSRKVSGRRRKTRKLRGGANIPMPPMPKPGIPRPSSPNPKSSSAAPLVKKEVNYILVNTNEEGPFKTPSGMPLPKGKKAVLKSNLAKLNANKPANVAKTNNTPANVNTPREKYLKKLFSMPDEYNWVKETAVARELIPFLVANASCTRATTPIEIPNLEVLNPYIPAMIERLERAQGEKLIKKLGAEYATAANVLKALLTETKEVECKSIEKAISALENAYGLLKWKELQRIEAELKNPGPSAYFNSTKLYKLAHKFLDEGDAFEGAPPDVLLKKYEVEMPSKFSRVEDYLEYLEKGYQYMQRTPKNKTKKSGNTGFGLLAAAVS